jgi:hypothetical protein
MLVFSKYYEMDYLTTGNFAVYYHEQHFVQVLAVAVSLHLRGFENYNYWRGHFLDLKQIFL